MSPAPATFQPMSGAVGGVCVATAFWTPWSKTWSVAFPPETVTKAFVMYRALSGTAKPAVEGRASSPK